MHHDPVPQVTLDALRRVKEVHAVSRQRVSLYSNSTYYGGASITPF
jgi:hypothetical protein